MATAIINLPTESDDAIKVNGQAVTILGYGPGNNVHIQLEDGSKGMVSRSYLLSADEALAEMDRIMGLVPASTNLEMCYDCDRPKDGCVCGNNPAEFERHLATMSDARLLEETAKFAKATLTPFETAALIDELCDRLRKQLELD